MASNGNNPDEDERARTESEVEPRCQRWRADEVDAVLRILRRKWTIPILDTLWSDALRQNELLDRLSITAKVLAETLRDLERLRIVRRLVRTGEGAVVRYELTPLARSLEPVLVALQAWFDASRGDLANERRAA